MWRVWALYLGSKMRVLKEFFSLVYDFGFRRVGIGERV